MLGDLAVRERRNGSEGVLINIIAEAQLPVFIIPTSEHRAILCQDHRVAAASKHLLGDLAVRERRNSSEGVSCIMIAQGYGTGAATDSCSEWKTVTPRSAPFAPMLMKWDVGSVVPRPPHGDSTVPSLTAAAGTCEWLGTEPYDPSSVTPGGTSSEPVKA